MSLSLILLAGCQWQQVVSVADVTPETYWVNYYPTQCNASPWGDTLEQAAIINYYTTVLGVTVHSLEITPPAAGYFSCSACGCPTGVQVSIQTDAIGRDSLLEHGFVTAELTEELTVDVPVETQAIEETVSVESRIMNNELREDQADQQLQQQAQLLQSALQDYYTQHGAYPDSLNDLTVQLDTTGMVYTPIGVTPAEYYDLTVDYSTGQELLNP